MQRVNEGALWQECVWDGYLAWPQERGGELRWVRGGEAGGTGDHEREASKSTVVFISRTTVTDLESAWGACI